MARRLLVLPALVLGLLVAGSTAAMACGGLVAPGHAEVLRRAVTLSAWHAGYEHYVTGFRFAGDASSFGYIVPLPGVPSNIQKGGGWTLERLERDHTISEDDLRRSEKDLQRLTDQFVAEIDSLLEHKEKELSEV